MAGTTACDKAQSDSIRLANLGKKAMERDDYREARIRFKEAVDVFPENARAHYGLGVSLIEFDELNQARKHLREASKLDTTMTEAFYQLGVVALRDDKLDEAEQSLRKALEQQPDHSAGQYTFSQLLERQGNIKDAETALRRSIVLDPYQPAAFLLLARLYTRVGAEDEAIAVLREGLRLCTDDKVESASQIAQLYNELGILLQQAGRYTESIEALTKAIRLPGATPEIVFNLGWAHASNGEVQPALSYFNQYIELAEPNNPAVRIAMNVARHLRQRLTADSDG